MKKQLKLCVLFLLISPTFYSQICTIYNDFQTTASLFSFNKPVVSNVFAGPAGGSTGTLKFNTNFSATRMTILYSNGNVGIGTTNPLEKLHVNGNILVPVNYNIKFGTENSSNGYLSIGSNLGAYNNYIEVKGNLYFRRVANDATNANLGSTLALQNDGSVTIGVWEKYNNTITPTDGHKLMVNGGILCESLKIIEDVPNADYVFEPNYKLMTFEQVATFIKNNKHLPNIPSAAEFTECGYKVGEMDEMLLRKVEELTLYMLQLNEQVEKLKKENEELRVKIGM